MSKKSNLNLKVMKVTIKKVIASYVEEWNDGEPCPNNCSERTYPNKEKAIAELKSEGYDDDEIDVDAYAYEEGWMLEEVVETYDTSEGYDITVV